jgi:Transposase
VYSSNPLAAARYRERHSVARSESDQADAVTLANILCVDAHLHRRLPADSELSQAIAVLARAHQDATWRRIKAHNELRSMLREFFPTFLATFTQRFALGMASPEARAVLAIAPTPPPAAKLTLSRIASALRRVAAAETSNRRPLTSGPSCAHRRCAYLRHAVGGNRVDPRSRSGLDDAVPQSGNLDISIGEVCGAAQVRPAFRLGDLFV